jgi:flagellar biosynthetic protein FliR
MLETIVLGQAITWVLVGSRIAGFVVGSPFPGANVPPMQRVGLVAGLAWVASMFATSAHAPRELGLALFGATALEFACGVAIGLTFRLIFLAADITGQLLSQAVGLSSASILNPTLEAQDTVLGRILTLFALLLALGAGVHRVALAYLLASFQELPVATVTVSAGSPLALIELAVSSFTVGVELAMPALGVALVVQIGLAMTARAAPSLQIFSVGFSVLLVTGFVVLVSCLHDIGAGLLAHYGSLPDRLDAVLVGLAGARP